MWGMYTKEGVKDVTQVSGLNSVNGHCGRLLKGHKLPLTCLVCTRLCNVTMSLLPCRGGVYFSTLEI